LTRYYLAILRCDANGLFFILGDRKVYLDQKDETIEYDYIPLYLLELLVEDDYVFIVINGYKVYLELEPARIYTGIKIKDRYFTNLEHEKPSTYKNSISYPDDQE
jgi:hypothetical protein